MTTSRAPCTETSVGVPLVVVTRTVFPSTASAVNSSGELPRSKPGMASIFRSPARRTSLRSKPFERVTTSSELSNGTTARAPLASATATVVDMRSTSITATTRFAIRPGVSCSGPRYTSQRTLHRLLHEVRLALQELRVDVAALEPLVLHHAGE